MQNHKGRISIMEESKKRVRRSANERAAEIDAKIQKHKDAIKLLEEKKAELFRPRKRRTEAEITKEILTKAKKAGLSSKEIAEKLGLELE